MPETDHDLSITGYALIGLFFVGHEILGLRTTLFLALALAGLLLAVSLVAALVMHLRQNRRTMRRPREWVGRRR